jgi:hypothetical protein
MRDDLIGFVLGALEPDEHEAIRQRAEQDRELQRQVQWVERCLQPLAAMRDEVVPPRGLAARTCQHLLTVTGGAVEEEARTPAAWEAALVAPPGEDAPPGGPLTRAPAWGNDRTEWSGESRQWTLADFVVAAGVCLAVSCLFFPAISNSRHNMQLAHCTNNMRQLGSSLDDFSRTAGGYFPVIPPAGNLSFSGVYAAKLAAKGLVSDSRVFLCPAKGNTVVLKIPPLQDIAAAQGPRLVTWHRTMGGDYAYTLGFVRQGQLYGIRNRGQ